MSSRSIPVRTDLTPIAIAWRPRDVDLIADDVLPRTPVSAKFKWLSWDQAGGYTIPDAKMGRKSKATEVDYSAVEVADEVKDWGLSSLVSNSDILDDNQGVDYLGNATAFTTGLVRLAREVRVASLVFNAATYVGGQQQTLSGTSQWSDQTNSDPLKAITDAMDVPIMRPNILVLGQVAWTNLRRHPKIVQACNLTQQTAGMVAKRAVADLLEVREIYVGASFINSAKEGQTPSYARAWGKHAALIYRDRDAGPQSGMTFGFTGDRRVLDVRQKDEPDLGVDGSQRVIVTERVKEVISASQCGYYFQNCVA